ncbi:MAG: DUF2480 family protein [Bacteroidetes bacterium]|jgi:hypothetical protein|nr:DUF2480 family protein [Bacteroidota bacterium]
MGQDGIINRVANSDLVNVDPGDFYPRFPVVELDIAPWLYQGLILKEKDFRHSVQHHDWQPYAGKHVGVHCSADAIVPPWAYMLVASHLAAQGAQCFLGNKEQYAIYLLHQAIEQYNFDSYIGKKVIVNGCGEFPIPDSAYLLLAHMLSSRAKSLMYGEACSTVPIYKTENQLNHGV